MGLKYNKMASIPKEFICPYSYELMKQPAIIACGCCFDSNAIKHYLESHDSCPECHQQLDHTRVCKNPELERRIQEYNRIQMQQVLNNKACIATWKGDSLNLKEVLQEGANPNSTLSDAWMKEHRFELPDYNDITEKYTAWNTTDYAGWTLLHWATMKGKYIICEMLLKYGAIPNIKNAISDLPIHVAAEHKHSHITELLLKHGADPNVLGCDKSTPLHYAAENGDIPLVKLLLKHGVNVSVENCDGITPLHYAAENGDVPLVELLLAHGANPNITADYGYGTPLDWAMDPRNKRLEHDRIIEILKPITDQMRTY